MQKYLKNYLMQSVSLHLNEVKKNISSFMISKQKKSFKNANKKKNLHLQSNQRHHKQGKTMLLMPSPWITRTWFQNQPFDLYLIEEAYFHLCICKEKKKTNQAKTTKSHPAQSAITSICKEQGCTVTPSRAGAHNTGIL